MSTLIINNNYRRPILCEAISRSAYHTTASRWRFLKALAELGTITGGIYTARAAERRIYGGSYPQFLRPAKPIYRGAFPDILHDLAEFVWAEGLNLGREVLVWLENRVFLIKPGQKTHQSFFVSWCRTCPVSHNQNPH